MKKEKFNKKAFEKLSENYESRVLLDAVDHLDKIRCIVCDPDGMRKNLMHLHTRAMNLINHGDREIPPNEHPIYDLADDLEYSVQECIESFEKILEVLNPLIELIPDPDDDDKNEKEDEEE